MFIGRKKELAVLEQAYDCPQSALIPIYFHLWRHPPVSQLF
jgi:hypothetical protein